MIWSVRGLSASNTHAYTVEPLVSCHPRTRTKCPLKRGVHVHLWEVKNVVFVCRWDHA